MLDALKDLYISYPFMPVENRPDLFTHIKDIRCVVTMNAANPISLVENDNYIRAWLVSITERRALIKVRCNQYDYLGVLEVPVYKASVGAPATNSYVLIDDAFVAPDSDIEYEIQPDTLLFIQKAPVIRITNNMGNTAQLPGPTITTAYDHNVSITKGQSGVIIYGAPGAGLGIYTDVPNCYTAQANLAGDGAISINGLYGYVRIDDAYPVDIIESFVAPNMTLTIRNGEITNETN